MLFVKFYNPYIFLLLNLYYVIETNKGKKRI